MKWDERESIAEKEILTGNVPSFIKQFVPVNVFINDSSGHRSVLLIMFRPTTYQSVTITTGHAYL